MIEQSFHYWTVKASLGKDYWHCACKCGTEKRVHGGSLRAGTSKSCGCWGTERYPLMNRTHGMSKTPEHRTWSGIKTRCYNPNVKNFDRYGGRGIKVCDRWKDFANFFEDMGPKPSPKHSIERIDSNGDYEPGNCRWATITEQASNKRNNVMLELNGEMVTGAEFARRTGFARCTVYEWTSVLKLTRDQIEERLIARQKATLDPRSGRSPDNT